VLGRRQGSRSPLGTPALWWALPFFWRRIFAGTSPATVRRSNDRSFFDLSAPPFRKQLGPRVRSFVTAISALQTACLGYHPPKPLIARDAQQIANVYVSAYPEVPWSDISAQLSPNLKMTIQQAQAIAVSTTAAQSLLVSTILAGDLAINFPTTATAAPASTAGAAQPTTTQSPGPVPTLPTPAQVPTPTNVAPTISLAPVDGTELLVTSTALFQQAAIIDNQISQQYIPLGYTAHLITFQINLQPTRDDWSYDAFVDITLLPSSLAAGVESSTAVHARSGGQGPIVVKPLIITDALETSSVQQSVQQIQQALLQLSGSLGKTGAAAGFNAGSNSERGISSYDKNTLVTAGRVSDATMRVRLGAAFSALGRPILVPRTYNVSLLVLTKAIADVDPDNTDTAGHNDPVTELSVITHTHFLPANYSDLNLDPDAAYVEETIRRGKQELAQRVADTLQRYGYPAISHGCTYRQPEPETKRPSFKIDGTKQRDTYLQLLRAVDREDFASIKACLRLKELQVTEEEKFKFFYSDMIALQATTHFSSLQIPLKDATPRLPEAEQLAVVSDSADQSQETVTLVGGQNLTLDQLRAEAIVSFPNGRREWLAPTGMTFSSAKPTQLAITFPNPGSLGPVNPPSAAEPTGTASHAGTIQGLQLNLAHVGANAPNSAYYFRLVKVSTSPESKTNAGQPSGQPGQAQAQGQGAAAPWAAPSPAVKVCAAGQKPITISSPLINSEWRSEGSKEGEVGVAVANLANVTKACAQTFGAMTTPSIVLPLTLAVSGARAAPDGACLVAANDKINLASTGLCQGSLKLTNFNSAVPVTLTVTDANGTSVGQTIQLIAP
jgi:hypothetical protein